MKAADTGGWAFTAPISDESEVKCNECGEFSPLSDWTEGYVGCEDCGDHDAMRCPRVECEHCEDHVYSDRKPMEVRP